MNDYFFWQNPYSFNLQNMVLCLGISIFLGFLVSNPSLWKSRKDTIWPIAGGG